MPDLPDPKLHPHPLRLPADDQPQVLVPEFPDVPYAGLQVLSNFSFLQGGSHPDELMQQAASLGYSAIALTDINTLAGIVRAHVAAKSAKIPFIPGCRLKLAEPAEREILVYPHDRNGYAHLCQLLTIGKRRAPKGQCHLTLHDLLEHHAGLLAVVIPPSSLDESFLELLEGLASTFDDDRLSLLACCRYDGNDRAQLTQLRTLARYTDIPLVAGNDVHYHSPDRRILQDVLTCIREDCSIEQAGLRLLPNAERHLKTPAEMARLFSSCPGSIERSVEIAQRALAFNLDELKYQYPDEVVPPGSTAMQHLAELTWAGSRTRYPQGLPDRIRTQIEHELRLIDELQYASYFLTVHDIVVFARGRHILCQGRGAAANSAVCYCLGVTAVDPDRVNLLFERFISRERNEPPDIDIDFEHERREEVIQYLYQKYGRDRAALTAEVISYRPRSAVREVGKALGLSLDIVDRLAKDLDWWKHDVQSTQLRSLGLNERDVTMRRWLDLSRELQGFPRHLSQHVGGFVITRGPLCHMVPIENAAMADRTIIEWDKDDIDAMGMLKVDVLGLGMLTCIRKTFEMVSEHHGLSLDLATTPAEDRATYDMISKADTVGVFQIESRAQMSMLPRLRPRCYYDLVIEVAIVRPGPIQGDMVHPYLRRRNGEEPVTYPNDAVKGVLGRTLGVPLFQEQAMSLAIVAAGFTAGEADQLRRAIAAWKSKQKVIYQFGKKLIEGMTRNGYPREFAERCFEQIKGFSEYGFPESHAASFAMLVYVSAYLKRHYPAAFAACLINSQPMGFYAPAQIVRDAKAHGVKVQPIDVNLSRWDCTLERDENFTSAQTQPAIRLGLRLVRGIREEEVHAIERAVQSRGPFRTIEALWRNSNISTATLRKLAAADAFGSMQLDRQAALWRIESLSDEPAPLFEMLEQADLLNDRPDDTGATETGLPRIPEMHKVGQDYESVGLSLKKHPVAFVRDELDARRVVLCSDLNDDARAPAGRMVNVAGLVLVRQRPGTAKGTVFITLEDESGIANLIIWPAIYQKFRRAARHGVLLQVRGRVQRQREVVHVVVYRIRDISAMLTGLHNMSRDFH